MSARQSRAFVNILSNLLLIPGKAFWCCLFLLFFYSQSSEAANKPNPNDSNTITGRRNDVHNKKIKLVFSVCQGFGNGPVVVSDINGVRRMCKEIEPLKNYYDVYTLVGPHVKNKSALKVILDVFKQEQIPFLFDAQSSDCMTLSAFPQNDAYDVAHGIEISIKDMGHYKQAYGKYFAGIRFMEVFGQDFMVRNMATHHPEWKHAGYKFMPDPNTPFFSAEIIKPYFKFAFENDMFIQWSDHTWYYFHPENAWQKQSEAELLALMKQYPKICIVTYANNEGNKVSMERFNNWQNALKPFTSNAAAEFGLSDQSWIYFIPDKCTEMECPPELIVNWAKNSLESGARLIQFEPCWYFFKFPRAELTPETVDYTQKPEWTNSGQAKNSFKQLSSFLIEYANGH